MAKNIRVNFEVMDETIHAYENAITDLTHAIQMADGAVSMLQTEGWTTEGAKKFFEEYDDSWKQNAQKDIEYCRHLLQCLCTAKAEFLRVYEQKIE